MRHAFPFTFLLGTLMLGPGPAARADEHWYGTACVHNETSQTIYFLVQVGESGERVQKHLHPGEWHIWWHEYDYANENESPPLYICFSVNGIWKHRRLQRCSAATTTPRDSYNYHFHYTTDGSIDLFACGGGTIWRLASH